MELSDKIIWWVLAAALLSAGIIALIKIGDVVVRRRTASMIAEHGGKADEPSSKE